MVSSQNAEDAKSDKMLGKGKGQVTGEAKVIIFMGSQSAGAGMFGKHKKILMPFHVLVLPR